MVRQLGVCKGGREHLLFIINEWILQGTDYLKFLWCLSQARQLQHENVVGVVFLIRHKCDQITRHFILECGKGTPTNAFSSVCADIFNVYSKTQGCFLCFYIFLPRCIAHLELCFSSVSLTWLVAYRPNQTTSTSKTVLIKPVLNLDYERFSSQNLLYCWQGKVSRNIMI